MKRYIILPVAFLFLFAIAVPAHAATFEVSGWIPWWRSATGTQEALMHLDTLTEANPFGFTVKKDGSLNDELMIDKEPWPSFFKAARAKKLRLIPTITWSDQSAMHTVLSNKVLRDAQIADIAAMVQKYNFDGVEIDYENKLAEDRSNFSIFLRDLYKVMGRKFVECDIEPRTPPASRYDTVPANFTEDYYANDYAAINKYCDRVKIMAYDQASIDRKLNALTVGPYSPVADPRWVEKVITLALQSISKNKILLGVATYGYEYKITPLTNSYYDYKFITAFNPAYAKEVEAQYGLTPLRNSAGELSLTYTPATNFLTDGSLHLLWWSDAQAVKDKVDLAKKYGLRGVSVFKIDGGADPGIWNVLK